MNKQELIDELVDLLDGKLRNHTQVYISGDRIYKYRSEFSSQAFFVCTTDEFTTRARELGWINGYKYGVEYKTNGKKPDLPDDVRVERKFNYGWSETSVLVENCFSWVGVTAFRIVDERYKPVSELVKQGQEICGKIEEKLSSVDNSLNWYDYDKQEPIALPPVGVECEYISSFFGTKKHYSGTCKVIAYYQEKVWIDVVGYNEFVIHTGVIKFRPLDWNRKACEEKRKFVDSLIARNFGGCIVTNSVAEAMYESGLFELKNT